MAAPTNADVLKALSGIATPMTVNTNNNASLATGATSQAAGLRANGEIFVVTQSVAGGSVVLPSINGGDAPSFMVIQNESANSINVGGAAGDKVNGTATTASFGAGIQAVAAASSCFFIASVSPLGAQGVATVSPNNWHTSVMS
jgi:hypothetical protein